MDIRNKVVIITGASAGIGLATAKLFAKSGAKVALAARYNFSFPAGYEEVEKILEGNPLKTF